MKDTSKNNENNRKYAKNTVMDTEIKDKIDFSFVIQDRLFMINKSFDSNDKYRIREAYLFFVTDLFKKLMLLKSLSRAELCTKIT